MNSMECLFIYFILVIVIVLILCRLSNLVRKRIYDMQVPKKKPPLRIL